MGLRLAIVEFQPILSRLAEKIIDRLAVILCQRPIFEEEAASIQIERNRRREMIQGRIAMRENIAIDLIDPAVEAIERAESGIDWHADIQMAQAAKSGRYIKCDVIVSMPAGKPRPRTVRKLHFGELLQRASHFGIQAIVLKENPDIFARFAFVLPL